jgi:hypothetical protein
MGSRDLKQRHRHLPAALALTLLGAALTPAGASAAGAELSATATPAGVSYGQTLSVAGRIVEEGRPLGGTALALQQNPYPYRGFATVARLTSAADGSFDFAALKLQRNTRIRVVAEGATAASSATLPVTVDPSSAINASSIAAGRARLSIRIAHTITAGSPSVSALWFVAAAGTRVFQLVAITPTRELAPGLTYASAMIDPPSRRFIYSVCLNPSWEAAMGAPSSHGACPRHDYTLAHDVG